MPFILPATMQVIDQLTLYIALVIAEFYLRKLLLQLLIKILKRSSAVNIYLSCADQVQVRAINNSNF